MVHKDYSINIINIIVAISIILNCLALFQPVFISERGIHSMLYIKEILQLRGLTYYMVL